MCSRVYHVILSFFLLITSTYGWGEEKHPISEVLVQHLLLTKNFLVCGTYASWGTNSYGAFIFDRKRQAWINLSKGYGLSSNKILKISK